MKLLLDFLLDTNNPGNAHILHNIYFFLFSNAVSVDGLADDTLTLRDAAGNGLELPMEQLSLIFSTGIQHNLFSLREKVQSDLSVSEKYRMYVPTADGLERMREFYKKENERLQQLIDNGNVRERRKWRDMINRNNERVKQYENKINQYNAFLAAQKKNNP